MQFVELIARNAWIKTSHFVGLFREGLQHNGPSHASPHTNVGPKDFFGEDLNQHFTDKVSSNCKCVRLLVSNHTRHHTTPTTAKITMLI